jgi:hypothetical protein
VYSRLGYHYVLVSFTEGNEFSSLVELKVLSDRSGAVVVIYCLLQFYSVNSEEGRRFFKCARMAER